MLEDTAHDAVAAAVDFDAHLLLVCLRSVLDGVGTDFAIVELYAFGNLSGWLYRVNGAFADVGCSQYRLQEGDAVEWMYTTDLGKDVGNSYMGF